MSSCKKSAEPNEEQDTGPSNSAARRIERSSEALSPFEVDKKVVKWQKEEDKANERDKEARIMNREIEAQ